MCDCHGRQGELEGGEPQHTAVQLLPALRLQIAAYRAMLEQRRSSGHPIPSEPYLKRSKASRALQDRLAAEALSLREEAQALPPGDLRQTVEEIAGYAEMLIEMARGTGDVLEIPASLRRLLWLTLQTKT
jgi:hypothetical protein